MTVTLADAIQFWGVVVSACAGVFTLGMLYQRFRTLERKVDRIEAHLTGDEQPDETG